jgi:RHS repeat-associated protein
MMKNVSLYWDGETVQHVEYVPFGEVFIEERNNTWNTPYLFNAKELDEETGLYYYGARYYDARSSLWLSTDPLQEKYPNVSSYAYCVQNPVKFVDPDGREKLIGFHPRGKIDRYAYKGAEKERDNSMIHIYAHGSPNGGIIYWQKQTDGKYINLHIESSKDLIKLLEQESDLWNNRKEGELIYIVLHSCNTGRGPGDEKEGKGIYSFADNFSYDVKDAVIVAPDEKILMTETREIGPLKSLNDKNIDISNLLLPGDWNYFYNGELLYSLPGYIKSQNIPNSLIQKTKEQYSDPFASKLVGKGFFLRSIRSEQINNYYNEKSND